MLGISPTSLINLALKSLEILKGTTMYKNIYRKTFYMLKKFIFTYKYKARLSSYLSYFLKILYFT